MPVRVTAEPGGATAQRARTMNVDLDALAAALRRRTGAEVRFDSLSRGLYATDASNYRQVPLGVVIPRTVEDVTETVAVCREHGAPLLNRGGGTSLAGQCCNVAVVLDYSKYVNRVLSIEPERRLARVQPGLVLDRLRHAAVEHGLTFGPDPATHAWCTLGGMLGNNSCGVHSVIAGRTADNVESMDVLTYDGLRLKVGPTSPDELEDLCRQPGRLGEIYRGLRDLVNEFGDEIRARYPNIPRRVSGYNLDELLPERGMNVARALVGSEGTCVTILEADLHLVEWPNDRVLVVLGYEDVYSAGDHVAQVMQHHPIGLEGMDAKLVHYMRKKGLNVEQIGLLPQGEGWLMAEFGGATRDEAEEAARAMMGALEREPDAPSMKLYRTDEEMTQIWEVRESGLGATAHVPGEDDTWPGWEDAAVHPDRLGEYLRRFRELLNKYEYDCSLYGHFGQACVHCRINFDLRSQEGLDRYRRFIDEAADLVTACGGVPSGEHGDGQARAALLPKVYGEALVDAFRKFKRIWDPAGGMNPGKVIDADEPVANLRLGTEYRPWTPQTRFAFPEDYNDFAEVSLRCVGVGKCRRGDHAFMCPSYLVTRDEKDSTRGRARILYEMLVGEEVRDRWKSEEVREALDLCLSCKGCKKECPVDVDMATYKSEFLSHYYQGRLRPRVAYAMGYIEEWARLAALMPRAANFMGQVRPFSTLLKAAGGIAAPRRLPRFANQTFSAWHENRGRVSPPMDTAQAVLYPDVFYDHFYPDSLRSALRVLERLGYRVAVPPSEGIGALRPLIHYGMLDRARRKARRVLETLEPALRLGAPVIGLEPSTVAVFREELPALLPRGDLVQRLKEQSYLFDEFLMEQHIDLPELRRKAVVHGHCHQKAVLDFGATQRALARMKVDAAYPEVGCCGLAGAFGFEAEHYDLSVQIGELNLLPAVRAASEDTLVITDGFSCRAQIEERAGRSAMHLADVAALAFDEADAHRKGG